MIAGAGPVEASDVRIVPLAEVLSPTSVPLDAAIASTASITTITRPPDGLSAVPDDDHRPPPPAAALTCLCGRTFATSYQLGGHRGKCAIHQASKSHPAGTASSTTSGRWGEKIPENIPASSVTIGHPVDVAATPPRVDAEKEHENLTVPAGAATGTEHEETVERRARRRVAAPIDRDRMPVSAPRCVDCGHLPRLHPDDGRCLMPRCGCPSYETTASA